jgi:hypothetical protein
VGEEAGVSREKGRRKDKEGGGMIEEEKRKRRWRW